MKALLLGLLLLPPPFQAAPHVSDPEVLQLLQQLGGDARLSEDALRRLADLAPRDGEAFQAVADVAANASHPLRLRALEELERMPSASSGYLELTSGGWHQLFMLLKAHPGLATGVASGYISLAELQDPLSELDIQSFWYRYYQLLDLGVPEVDEAVASRLKRELRAPKKSRAWTELPLRGGSLNHRIAALRLLKKVGPQALGLQLDLEALKEEGEPRLSAAVEEVLADFDQALLKGRRGWLKGRALKDMERMAREMGGLAALRAKSPRLAAYLARSLERARRGPEPKTHRQLRQEQPPLLDEPAPRKD